MAMLQSRIGRLPPFQRLLLRAASVLGQDFSRGGLRALLGAAADSVDLDSQLVELIDAEIVVRMTTGATGESTYAFRHALLRDAAYTLLTDADRSLGHRLAARYLAGLAEREAPAIPCATFEPIRWPSPNTTARAATPKSQCPTTFSPRRRLFRTTI